MKHEVFVFRVPISTIHDIQNVVYSVSCYMGRECTRHCVRDGIRWHVTPSLSRGPLKDSIACWDQLYDLTLKVGTESNASQPTPRPMRRGRRVAAFIVGAAYLARESLKARYRVYCIGILYRSVAYATASVVMIKIPGSLPATTENTHRE